MHTIAAIATPHAAGGIAVIRISGSNARSVAQACFRSVTGKSVSEMPGYTCAYGKFVDPSGAELDDGIVTVFRAPHSYTGEDVVELSCHGGIFVTRQLLENVYAAGAAPAEPGEFTKRAFLNGRIDLSQAEAVIDVIQAKNEYALRSSVSQLKGAVQQVIEALRKEIIYHIALIESALDDPEHISLDGYPEPTMVE